MLPQLASKLRAVEFGSPEKVPRKVAFYYINRHNSGTFLDFQIQQLAILKPVEVGKVVKIKEMSFLLSKC